MKDRDGTDLYVMAILALWVVAIATLVAVVFA